MLLELNALRDQIRNQKTASRVLSMDGWITHEKAEEWLKVLDEMDVLYQELEPHQVDHKDEIYGWTVKVLDTTYKKRP